VEVEVLSTLVVRFVVVQRLAEAAANLVKRLKC